MDTELLEVLSVLSPVQTLLLIIMVLLLTNIPLITKMLSDKYKERKHPQPLECRYKMQEFFKAEIKPWLSNSIKLLLIEREHSENETLQCMMAQVDKSIVKVHSRIMKTYRANCSSEKDIRYFESLNESALLVAKNSIKEWIKKNHIADYSDEGFRKYVEDTTNSTIDVWATDLFKSYHNDDFVISSSELHELNMTYNLNPITKEIEDLLYELRGISIEKHKKLDKVEDQILGSDK